MRKPGDTWVDVADIAVRTFFERFKHFKNIVLGKQGRGKLGKVKAFAYSIELQQRGSCG